MTSAGRHWLYVGVAGAIVAYLAMVTVQIFAVRPFGSADESAHVDYALGVAHGNIPRAGAIIDPAMPDQPAKVQHVSYHPPLYHAIVGIPLRLGIAVNHPHAGLYAARLVTAMFTIATIIVVAALAMSLFTRARVPLAIAAAGLAAIFPPLVSPSGTVHNDALAALCAAGALLALVRVVRFGATPLRMAMLSLSCAAGLATRATAVVVLAAVMGTLVVAALLGTGRSRVRRLGIGSAQAGLVFAVSAAGAGWFYLLNRSRYGDLLGAGYDDEHPWTVRGRLDGPLTYLSGSDSYTGLWQQIFGGTPSLHPHNEGWVVGLASLAAAVIGLGLVALAVRAFLARRSVSFWTVEGRRSILAGSAIAAVMVGTLLEISKHTQGGGAPHGRYMATGLVAYALGVAVALHAFAAPRLRRVGATLAALSLCAVLGWAAIGYLGRLLPYLRRRPELAGDNWFDTVAGSLSANGAPAGSALFAVQVITLLAGLGALGVALWVTTTNDSLGSRADDQVSEQRD